jgi:Rrf2 family protein
MSKIVTLSEAASIGLHSMVLIARSKEKLNVGKIADYIDSSRHHVAKVMQRLAKEEFVSSNRGPSGGFVLKKEPESITLLNIYEAIEGRVAIQNCPGHKPKCPFGSCLLGDLSHNMTVEFRDYMESHTLAEYL